MFKCDHCGQIFDEPQEWRENNDLPGLPYETFSACPYCGESFSEVVRCEICGEYYTEEQLTVGVCDNCIYEYKAYRDCKDIFDGETFKIDVDYLTAMLLDEATINDILRRYIKERLNDTDCTEAIDGDKVWFAEMLIKKMEEDK